MNKHVLAKVVERGGGCPYCKKAKRLIQSINSVTIECEKGHRYETSSWKIAKNKGCPICETKNIRPAEKISFQGKNYKSIREMAEELGVNYSSVMARIRHGIPLERAFKEQNKDNRFKDWGEFVAREKRFKEIDRNFNPISDWVENVVSKSKEENWSQDEEDQLAEFAKEGVIYDTIAIRMGKTVDAIVQKMKDLKIFEEHAKALPDYLQSLADDAKEEKITKNSGESKTTPSQVLRIIEHAEDKVTEFKQTFSKCLRSQNSKDGKIMLSTLKTIAAFANAKGGQLIIGVHDKSREVTGLALDDHGDDHDKYMLNLMNRINSTMSAFAGTLVDPEIIEIEKGKAVCLIKVEQSTKPVFLDYKEYTGNVDGGKFFVRQTGQTIALATNELHPYISKHFD